MHVNFREFAGVGYFSIDLYLVPVARYHCDVALPQVAVGHPHGFISFGGIRHDYISGRVVGRPVRFVAFEAGILHVAAFAYFLLYREHRFDTAPIGPQALPGKVVEDNHDRGGAERGGSRHIVLLPLGAIYRSIGVVDDVVVAPIVDDFDAWLGMARRTHDLPLGPEVETDGFAGGGVEKLVGKSRFGGGFVHVERFGIYYGICHAACVGRYAPVRQVVLKAGILQPIGTLAVYVIFNHLHTQLVETQLAALPFTGVNGQHYRTGRGFGGYLFQVPFIAGHRSLRLLQHIPVGIVKFDT